MAFAHLCFITIVFSFFFKPQSDIIFMAIIEFTCFVIFPLFYTHTIFKKLYLEVKESTLLEIELIYSGIGSLHLLNFNHFFIRS